MSIRKLAVPDANADNLFVLHSSEMGCCPDASLEVCKYVVDVADLTNVTSITLTVNGVNTAFAFDAAANTDKEIRVAITKALRSAGYDPFYEDNYKGVVSIVNGNQVIMIGEAIPVSLNVDGSDEPFEKRCVAGRSCVYTFAIPTEKVFGDVVYNGSAGTTVVDGGDGFTDAEVPAALAALKTALDTESVPWTLATVTEASGTFTIEIHLEGEAEISIGIFDGILRNCYMDFHAA